MPRASILDYRKIMERRMTFVAMRCRFSCIEDLLFIYSDEGVGEEKKKEKRSGKMSRKKKRNNKNRLAITRCTEWEE